MARHGLGIDTVPTLGNITKFAMHLLSECKQLSQMEKKNVSTNVKVEPKVKAMEHEKEEGRGKGKGREKSAEDDRGECEKVAKCKFFLTPKVAERVGTASSRMQKKMGKGDVTFVGQKNI